MRQNFTFLIKRIAFFSFISNLTPIFSQQISLSPIGEKRIVLSEKEIDNTDYSSLNWLEIVEERTAHSATFKAPGGYIKMEQNQLPIHRKVNDKWERIDPVMLPHGENSWHAPNQDFPIYLNKSGIFQLSTSDANTWSFGAESFVQGNPVNYAFASQDGNSFYFNTNDYPIVKELLALENRIKFNYRIEESFPLHEDYFVVKERIILPTGLRLHHEKETNQSIWGIREVSTIFILNDKNEIQGKIHPAYAVDANQNSEPAQYKLSAINESEYDLEILLSKNWLLSSSRTFPILLDPLVVGPTSNWTGGQMPSCMSPQQNIDSILVTIPAGVTVTSLAVRSSFYADPWTGATMSMGAMQFSTTCNSTALYQIDGALGNQPGTAYLDSANMLNPLLCCFAQSCNSQQFYLRKHLSRTAPGTGCNANFIRYDPFTTQWPFRAIVYGRTPETYAAEWTVPQSQRCSDNCEFNATAYVRYGVPPFTLTHPWQDTIIIQGNPNGCNSGQNSVQFQLNIPNCPIYCDDTYTALPVPIPTIIDACGVAVENIPLRSLNIKPAIQITPFADTVFCAGETIDFQLSHCLGTNGISWSADPFAGDTQVNITTESNLGGTLVYYFLVTAILNGCEAEPYFQPVYVFPLPTVSFEVSSQNTYLGDLIDFQNTSTGVSLDGNAWFWTFGDSTTQISTHAQHTYTDIGNFEVCLSLLGGESCANTFCQIIPVVPNAIDVPNVFTPNNDGSNDLLNLFFDWAESVEMTILNRWGNQVATVSITDYDTGWNGKQDNTGVDLPDGVYFYRYIITTSVGSTLEGQSFVHLIR